MRNVNLSNVADEAPRPQAGGYVLTIADVTDVPMDPKTGKGDYLTIDYDLAEGEFAEYYYGKYKTFGFWGGHFIRSYKALVFSPAVDIRPLNRSENSRMFSANFFRSASSSSTFPASKDAVVLVHVLNHCFLLFMPAAST